MDVDEQALQSLARAFLSIKVHHSKAAGDAKKKPLLLLLVLSRIEHGQMTSNEIRFQDVEAELGRLIECFGGRSASGAKPEQPFFHLRSAPFWHIELEDSGDFLLFRQNDQCRLQ
jgi:putative restriction endonuclease